MTVGPALVSFAHSVGPALVRFALFTAIALMVGSACFRTLVLPRARLGEEGEAKALGDEMAAGATRLGLAAAALFVPAVLLVLAFQLAEFRDPLEPLRSELALLLERTSWGAAWKAQGVIAAAAFVAFAGAERWKASPAWLWASSLAALAAAVTPALSGHSFAADPKALAIAADALHVLGAGVWIGTLAVLLLVSGPRARALGARGLGALVIAFSPFALASAGAVVFTGVIAWWLHVGSLQALWTNPYGRLLLFKVTVVVGVACVGAFNWRRLTPRLMRGEGGQTLLARSVPLELALGLVALLVTAFLVASAPPLTG